MRTFVALVVLSLLLVACPTEPDLVMVTFDSQGGTAVPDQTIQRGTQATAPAAPTKDGFILSGWFTDPTDGIAWNFNTPVANSITLHARWTQVHTVAFDSQGGGSVATQLVEPDQPALDPGDPGKTGATFQGWYTASTGGVLWEFSSVMTQDTTLYAQWLYALEYASANTDEGSVNGDLKQEVRHGGHGTAVSADAAEGFSFERWSDGNTANPRTDENVTESISLTAIFSWNVYNLSYTASEGGSILGSAQQIVSHGENGSLVEAVANDGYGFAGWSDGAVPTRTRTDRNVQASLSVTASFRPASYTVSFDTHGSSAITSQTIVRGSCPTEPEADPTREGYRFKDWFTDAETESYFDFSDKVYADVVVHAQWIEQFTVTFDSQGGSTVSSYVVDDETPITAPDPPTKTGHIFDGWYTGANATGNKWTFGVDRITADTTLHAAWDVLSFDVTYRAELASGSSPTTGSHQYGSLVTVAGQGDLSKEGSIFNGWNTVSDGSGLSYGPGALFTMPENEVFLYAQWTTSPLFTLAYHANGGSGAVPVEGAFVSGTNVAIQDNTGNLTKSGCYFAGWNAAADGSGLSYGPQSILVMPASDVTLHAQWAVQQYTVYLGYGNGEATGEITVDHGDAIPEPEDPTYVGHTFSGWFADSSFITTWNFATPITAQTTIYGKWTKNSYNLSYHANGGAGASPADPASYEYDQDVQVQQNTFTRAGYTFKEWNAMPNGSGIALRGSDTLSMPAEDTVLYAIWTPNEYMLGYDGNGSDGGSVPAAHVVNTGATVTIAAATMTKTGHVFGFWNEVRDGSGDPWTSGASLTMPSQSVVLYAQWIPVSYTITFDAAGGSVIPSQTESYGNLLDEPGVPIKDGATFGGWQRANGVLWNFSSDTVQSDVTLVARWVVDQHLVQFDSQGGSAIEPVLVDHGTPAAESDDPTRTGYDFSGWYTASIDGAKWNFETAVNSGMTLFARWTRKSFSVVFESSGGTAVASQSILFEHLAEKPADPTKTPFAFAGWFADEALGDSWEFSTDMVLGATTLYAKWVLPALSSLAVVAGDSHTLVVDSSGKVFAFGENEYGQLGNSDFSDISSAVETLRGSSSFAAVSVAAGFGHTLVVDQDGSLWVSGMNRYYGQLGAGFDPETDSGRNSFINVPLGGKATFVAAGYLHSVVLLENGELLGAGFNGSRQLAIPDTTAQDTFVTIASKVEQVWAGGYDTFFKKSDGTLWGTGYNRYGQLGSGTFTEYSDGAIPIVYASTNTPVRDVKQVAVGGGHVLFLLEDGRVYASGLNSSGQLGIGSTADSAQLKYVTEGVELVAAGDHHSALLKRDGSLWMFGNNLFGQLGDGTKTNRSSPVRIATLGNKVYRVSAGYGHTVVMLHDMSILGTGLNSSGQLGAADTNNRLVFTEAAD